VQNPAGDQDLLRELFEVWNPLGVEGFFVLIRGYVDESYNDHVFTLSSLNAKGKTWAEFSRLWKITLNTWNRRLVAQGRPTISRYHTTDCSNLKREFKGWSKEEQREFFLDLVKVFSRHRMDAVSVSVNLDEFHRIIPEARRIATPDFPTFIYGMMIKLLMGRITDRYCVEHPETQITLVQEACQYSANALDAYTQAINDVGFEHRECFVSFASATPTTCIPLQAADLLAYEFFKESMRAINPRDRRASLEALLDLDKLGGRSQFMTTNAILQLKYALQLSGHLVV
jgi:hypothetical protein